MPRGSPENEWDRARQARIAENQKRMQELGLQTAAAALRETTTQAARPKAPAQPRKRRQQFEMEVEVRRSGRLRGAQPETYAEDQLFERIGIDRVDLLDAPRRVRVSVDPTRLAELRESAARRAGEEAPRGPFDSGRGVRIQGGRVYDSKYGVTCHWCRQKTLEDHVTCTNEHCGEGRKLPVSFCKMCLMNRHGEDIAQAEASGCWVCPPCRGACGEGCTACCNCGPCRKKAGLGPTRQMIKEARAAGFTNVHDFLVHNRTGESAEAIAARKEAFTWGAWLKVLYEPAASDDEETEDEEEAAEQAQQPATAAAGAGAALELPAGEEAQQQQAAAAAAEMPARTRRVSRLAATVTEYFAVTKESKSGAAALAASELKSADPEAQLSRKERMKRKMGLGRLGLAQG